MTTSVHVASICPSDSCEQAISERLVGIFSLQICNRLKDELMRFNGQRFKVTVTSHKKKTKKTFLRSVKSLRSAKTLFWCRNAPKEGKTVLYTEFVASLKLWINLATDL